MTKKIYALMLAAMLAVSMNAFAADCKKTTSCEIKDSSCKEQKECCKEHKECCKDKSKCEKHTHCEKK